MYLLLQISFVNVCLVYAHSHMTVAKSCWPVYLSVEKGVVFNSH